MSKRNIKYIIKIAIIIAVLFAVSVGLALIIKNASNSKQVPVKDEDISFVAETNSIMIKGIVSVSDDFGKNISERNNGAFGYLKFDVINRTKYDRSYQIFITKKDSEKKEINGGYITFYLTDLMDQPMSGYQVNKLPTYNDLRYPSDKPDSRVLYSGLVKGNDRKQFILRVWIDETYVVSNEDVDFSFDISARAI